MKTSLDIAREARLRPVAEIADELGLLPDEVELYGPYKAKIALKALARLADLPDGKEIVVTAITPTPLGEGKTTTTIGLAQGLNRIGVRAAPTIRQPSLGPVFGLKGGAAGGGFSQVLPMEEINIHFTGDLHAVAAAHNLGAAFLDNHIFRGNELGVDPQTIRWPRVIDINDRALRRVLIGIGEKTDVRESEWHITAASEVMAILALADDIADLRRRIGRSIVAENYQGEPVTLEDVKVAGAMTVLLREAMKPNLVQTLEGGPAFIHAGPFANIAHGNSSVVADRIALKLLDAVCTEAGFGSDMGFQKFIDIKCRLSGIRPAAAVVVATIRALKMHGGVGHVVAGKPLDPALGEENEEGVRRGCENLVQHIEIVRGYGVPAVVAINSFPTDHASEVEIVREAAVAAGASACVVERPFLSRRRRSGKPRPRGVGGRGRRGAGLPIPVARGRLPRGADRTHRHPRLRRGRSGLLGRGPQTAPRVRASRLRPPPGLHGEDGALAQPRPHPQGPAERLSRPHPRRTTLCRRRLCDRLLR